MDGLTLAFQDQYLEIAKQLPGYEPRPAQEEMVMAITEALHSGQSLVVEAGTGSGKSFGYLIPALLTHQRPIVVSTGTIALQEQLIEKDIPFLAHAMGRDDLIVKLVKGRRNYLCLQKLQEFERQLGPMDRERLYVNAIRSSFEAGWTGDRAALDVEIPPAIWDEIASDSDDCLGQRCGYFRENPYRLAREDLTKADILVVNHALYLQDVASGQALLPPHDVVIFDEAHHLKSVSLRALTARIGKFATSKLIRKINRRIQAIPEGFQQAIANIEAQMLHWLFRMEKYSFRIVPDAMFFALVEQQVAVLSELRSWLAATDIRQLSVSSELERDRATVQREKLLNQLDGLAARWAFFVEFQDVDRVNWAEINKERLYYELKSTPLNVADTLKRHVWEEKTAIFTSATLATNHNLGFFRQDIGLSRGHGITQDRVLESPFSFKDQCELYIPEHLPEPNDPLFLPQATDEITKILLQTEGRAFVLFTSFGAMDAVSRAIIPEVPFPCRVQGDMPKNRLIQWFKQTPNAVLFATSTFWEGIDIPGESLSCVIIDRIPFATPEDPVHQAMVERLKRLGGDWFNGFVLPEATIRLKQGVGRLIRAKSDTGLLVILDKRLVTKGYGKTVVRSLPEARRIPSLADSTLFPLRPSLPV